MIDLTQLTQARQLSALNWGVTRPDELSELEAAVDAVLQADQLYLCETHTQIAGPTEDCIIGVTNTAKATLTIQGGDFDPCTVQPVVVVPVKETPQ